VRTFCTHQYHPDWQNTWKGQVEPLLYFLVKWDGSLGELTEVTYVPELVQDVTYRIVSCDGGTGGRQT
jgi:hypothetical protein